MEVIQGNDQLGTGSSSSGSQETPTNKPMLATLAATTIIESPLQTSTMRSNIVPSKRIHNVASACVNCRKAHLACDVNRPCRRCVTLGKADSCQDIKHKKRGRPKLNPRNSQSTYIDKYEIMRGTIYMPTFTNGSSSGSSSSNTGNNNSNNGHHGNPSSSHSNNSHSNNSNNNNNNSSSSSSSSSNTRKDDENGALDKGKPIAFCHQHAESFQQDDKRRMMAASMTMNSNSGSPSGGSSNSMAPVHLTASASSNPEMIDPHAPLQPQRYDSRRLTLILTMDICCARMSDNVIRSLGYFPQELAHRSLYEFLAPDDKDRLAHLHRQLLVSVMEAMQADPATASMAPPPAERSTSDLFFNKRPDELALIANGAKTFRDTLRFKTQQNALQQYDVCAYLGGALGADLTLPSTFRKLYIAMICHASSPPAVENEAALSHPSQQTLQAPPPPPPPAPPPMQTAAAAAAVAAHLGISPMRPNLQLTPRPRRLPNLQPRTFKAIAPQPAEASDAAAAAANGGHVASASAIKKGPPSIGAPKDFRHVSLPAHFTNNSTLNTISFRMTHEPPKINVAPTTSRFDIATSSSSPSSSSPHSDHANAPPRPASHASSSSSSTAAPSSSSSPASPGKLTTISTKWSNSRVPPPLSPHGGAPSSSSSSSSTMPMAPPQQHPPSSSYSLPPGASAPPSESRYTRMPPPICGPWPSPAVTHPTTQYFLQTSSSTLNAAASNTQRVSKMSNNGMQPAPASSSSEIPPNTRRPGMSIHSLLC
ncbi:hypothetical protein BC940DRAFT_369794 [Gongronella butleri]|nr:hypothetical protein BC940DRAFT_369794 [Gongronella butleri]